MLNMKYIKYILPIFGTLLIAGYVSAAPIANVMRSILPETTNLYYIGTSSPSLLEYRGIYTKDLTVSGTCTGCGGGGTFEWTPQSWGNSTSTILGFPGFISTASSTFSSLGTGGLGVNNGLLYNAATSTLSTITGTLAVSKGGTGQTSFGQGWLHSDGTTLTSSTSPTVNYLTATSTTASSTFAYGVYIGGRLQLSGLGANCESTQTLASNGTGFVYCQTATISGVSLGGTLAELTATDGTLTFSGTYTGATARTIGLNLANANTWTGGQTFGNSTTTGTFTLPVGASVITPLAGNMAIDTTTGQLQYSDVDGTVRVAPPFSTTGFQYATSTTWTGTTTIYLAPASAALTFNSIACETSIGTVGVSLYDGTNRADYISTASTTINTFVYSINNTFTKNESIRVDIGTPASSPVKIACRFKYQYTAD